MSGRFPIRNGLKQGDALTPLLFNFALDYAIKRIHANRLNNLQKDNSTFNHADAKKIVCRIGWEESLGLDWDNCLPYNAFLKYKISLLKQQTKLFSL